ncbi:MAG TPA: PDZ domain-containing protein, partial [Bacteroidales bacterium]|nr:PDZ domain-containing protein [Bacteroidales bacterium]
PSIIWLYDLYTKKTTPVTSEWYDCNNPTFSNDGKYLFFSSNRDFNPIYSWTEWNHVYIDMAKLYFITLNKKVLNPLSPINDEVTINKDNNINKKDKDNKNEIINIDLDGIIDRIIALPLPQGKYWNITVIDNSVFYMYSSKENYKNGLYLYEIDKDKNTKLGDFVNYEISFDKKKMLIKTHDNKYAIIDLPKNEINIKNNEYVDLSNMKVTVNLKEEWQQIFNEAWRQMKYFFYDPNMHGINWDQIKDKYQPLIPHVNSRLDLTYVIGEMIGELNVGHAYVGGGDIPKIQKINMGLLGAKLSKHYSGYYRIDKILKGENWSKDLRSPLTEVGVDVKEGDFIIAINGKSVKDLPDIYMALINTADKQVELTVNEKPEEKGSHKTIVVPIANENKLYYFNWVQENINKVNKATNGLVGYIHIPDMGVEGLNEFAKYYYPQLSKRALIIDDRGNSGGNVSPMIIERLNRELVLMKMGRNISPSTQPDAMVFGPKVCLIDAYSASDGDLFAYQFKKLNIGKVIGVRSWGGVVGIRGSLPFIDGGFLSKPEFAHYAADGSDWIIEGYGVDPDIYIDNDPAKEYEGEDQQLNKAIEIILEEMKKYPNSLPNIPPFPDKSK